MANPVTLGCIMTTILCLLPWVAPGEGSDVTQFAYYGDPSSTGPRPDQWGDAPEWRTCSFGTEQSPINIQTNSTILETSLQRLDTSYVPADGSVFVSSANILEVELRGGGRFKIGDTVYNLRQFHFHSPSEHTIDDVRFPLEVHLVHKSDSGDIAVIGILFSYGKKNAFLDSFWDKLPLLTSPNVVVNLTNVDVRPPNLRMGPTYARYTGSLTTPPCSEKVTWTVILGEVNTVSRRQMWTYSKVLPHSNARPIQKLNDRRVRKSLTILNRR